MFDIFYTGIITFIIMLLLHHLYNYLQSNLTIPKVNEIIQPYILHDLHEIKQENQKHKEVKDELKEYLNQFKKK